MRRRLVNFGCGLSLFLAAAFGAVWLRSVLVYSDGVRWTVHDDARRSVRTVYVVSGGGSVCVAWYTNDMPSLSDQAWAMVRREPGSTGAEYGRDRFVSPGLEATWLNYRGAYAAGFGWAARRERGSRMWMAGVPYWSLVVLALAGPAWGMARARRRWRRGQRGLCARCGYDVRETPERCPECGAAPGEERAALDAAVRRHAVVAKLVCLLALTGVVTWATVKLHRDLVERDERRRLRE